MTLLIALVAFGAGVVVVIVATQRLLEGLVGIAKAVRVAPFVASVVLSGIEAENVAVGLAAGARGAADVALGTAFGGAIFLLCAALGLGAVIAPLRVRLPRSVVLLVPAAALAAGLPVVFGVTPRWTGAILLAAFGLAIAYLVAASRRHHFVESAEVREASEKQRSMTAIVLVTIVGIALIAAGGELVAYGADGIIHTAGLSAGLVGMIIAPAAIEAEEIIRQAVPAQRGYADVSAGNAVGTVLYFLLFNLGLIALFTPVVVPTRVRLLDWPFLVASTIVASLFLIRGRVNRLEGAALAGLGVAYVALHVVIA
jgi:cation:H+ antiporter